MASTATFTFTRSPLRFAIHRLAPATSIPGSIASLPFVTISRTRDELSLLVPTTVPLADHFPAASLGELKTEQTYAAFKISAVLDFALVGILAGVSNLLAKVGVSIFVVSTFDTDYVLVKEENVEKAVKALEEVGHKVVEGEI
ncbi:ACT domain-domain-containing protein [Catenaria anguillulae PL171]|uniref:ACT domain-domain-containing protein n=1 Tax=Catenaria anguillulae PL171 TaxID=765915 RepID=A0A1Y2HSX8_9FUNG|nr:ACT domain-domain-containing protein [Catenaria anguillulae PL171]